jgi:hypothetical protein
VLDRVSTVIDRDTIAETEVLAITVASNSMARACCPAAKRAQLGPDTVGQLQRGFRMPDGDGAGARLPEGAPDTLKQFVACTVDRVELDLDDLGWIPRPPLVPEGLEPEVTVTDGWTPASATIRIGWGMIALEFPATITDGKLGIDASNLGEDISGGVSKWVDAFNETLGKNDKQLESFDVRDGKVVMNKHKVVATEEDPATVTPPTVIPPTDPPPTDPPGTTEPVEEPPWWKACPLWMIGVIIAILAVVVILFALNSGGDGDDTVSTGSPAPIVDPPPDDPPPDDPPPDDPPPDDPPPDDPPPDDPPPDEPPPDDPPPDDPPPDDPPPDDPPPDDPPPDDPPPDDPPPDEPSALDAAFKDLIDSMVPLVPTDGGKLDEDGNIVESTPNCSLLDIAMRAGIAPNGHVVFYMEGPPEVLADIAIEFDAVGPDGFTVVAETGYLGIGGLYPPWALTAPAGTVLTIDENPIPFDPLPERVFGIVTTDITSAADFTKISNWLYAGKDEGVYCYAHYEFLLSELADGLNLVTLGQITEDNADLDEFVQVQQMLESVNSEEAKIAWGEPVIP